MKLEFVRFFDDWRTIFHGETFAEPGRSYYVDDPPLGNPEIGQTSDSTKKVYRYNPGSEVREIRTCGHKTTMSYDWKRVWRISEMRKVMHPDRSTTPS